MIKYQNFCHVDILLISSTKIIAFYYCCCYSFLSSSMSWYSALSIHHSSLRTDHFMWDRKQFFFKFFQQHHNGKGGNTVTVGEPKMECLGHKKRPIPERQEMHDEHILSALKLTSFTNSQFTLISYKCGKSSTIRR